MRLASLCIFALLLLTLLVGCRVNQRHAAPALDRPHVVVMTYNVNYGLAGDPSTLDAIRNSLSDIVLLQETNAAWEEVLRAALATQYPHMVFHHHDPAGGLAVLSRYPLLEQELLEPVSWFPAWRGVTETALGPLQLLNVHLRPPFSDRGSVIGGYFMTPAVRQREIEHFSGSLDPDLPTLVVGDFNESERGKAATHLHRLGLRSALREFDRYGHTWRWDSSVIPLRGRYDHLMHDPRLEPLFVEVLRAGRSDHLPVRGAFALARRETE